MYTQRKLSLLSRRPRIPRWGVLRLEFRRCPSRRGYVVFLLVVGYCSFPCRHVRSFPGGAQVHVNRERTTSWPVVQFWGFIDGSFLPIGMLGAKTNLYTKAGAKMISV